MWKPQLGRCESLIKSNLEDVFLVVGFGVVAWDQKAFTSMVIVKFLIFMPMIENSSKLMVRSYLPLIP